MADNQYQISRSTGICGETGQVLDPGSPCVATLCDSLDEGGFERVDFSPAAWEAGARPPRLFGFWKTIVEGGERKTKTPVNDVVLLDLLGQLKEDEKPGRTALRFVLALLLLRSRRIRFLRSRKVGEREVWVMRIRGEEGDASLLEVENPGLCDADVRDLACQIGDVLGPEL